jgi:hypothetical protein
MSPNEALQAVAALSARVHALEAKVAELEQASGEKEAAATLSDDELRQGGLDSLIGRRIPDLGDF